MAFLFAVEDAVEVQYDPIGHHKHWTVLIGRLLEGSMRVSERIAIPYDDGLDFVAILGGFESKFRSQVQRATTISAKEATDTIGVMTTHPAAAKKRVQRAEARDCTDAYYQAILLEGLKQDPSRFFHAHEDSWIDSKGVKQKGLFGCGDCRWPLWELEGVEAVLETLTRHGDSYIAVCAKDLLYAKHAPRPAQKETVSPWWKRWWRF